jgi:hypothetical protein
MGSWVPSSVGKAPSSSGEGVEALFVQAVTARAIRIMLKKTRIYLLFIVLAPLLKITGFIWWECVFPKEGE